MQLQSTLQNYLGVSVKLKKINDKSMDSVLRGVASTNSIKHLKFDDVLITKNAAVRFIEHFKDPLSNR